MTCLCNTNTPSHTAYSALLRFYVPLFVVVSLLIVDMWTKHMVYAYFNGDIFTAGEIPVWHSSLGIDFAITYTANHGAAWGWLASWQTALLCLRLVAVLVLLIYLYLGHLETTRIFPVVLVLAGAIGNILDTFIYGHVVDFLLFTFWGYNFAVFNVADSAITLGIVLLLIQSSLKKDCHA